MTAITGNSPQAPVQLFLTPDGHNMAPLSASNPMPITGSISATNPSVAASGSADPGFGTVVGFISGGNVAEVSAANPLPVSASIGESALNVTGTANSAAVLSNFPVNPTTGYRSVLVQVTNAGSTCTLVAEQSNDGTTWTGMQTIADTAIEASTPMTTTGQYVFNITALEFRIRCSVYGSGNPAVNAEFRQAVAVPLDIPYLSQINSTLGSGVTVSQGTAASLNATVVTTGGATIAKDSSLSTINTTLGSPFQAGGSIANTSFASTQSGTWTVGLSAAQTLATVTTVGTLTTITNDVNTLPATDVKVSGTANVTGTSSTSLIGVVLGKRVYVTAISLSNTSATTVTVNFQDGSGGTTLWTSIVPAGGGSNLSAGGAPLFWTTSGNALFFAASGSATTVYANAAGFSGS